MTQLDVNRANAHDRNLVIPLILVVVFVILGLLLRRMTALPGRARMGRLLSNLRPGR